MKYLNLFQDNIEIYPDLLTTVFTAAEPWFLNRSLQGNLDAEVGKSLGALCATMAMSPIDAINRHVISRTLKEDFGALFFWCEESDDGLSLHGLAYTENQSRKTPKNHTSIR